MPKGIRERLAARSSVLPVGIAGPPHPAEAFAPYLGGRCDAGLGPGWPRDPGGHVILWNHRWEFDKRPEMFARALLQLAERGRDFRLLLLGEPRQQESAFAPLRDRLGGRILAWGEQDRARYRELLAQADIVVSCAAQEYFGISVAEAVHAGCYPVLPRDQAYPSLYGARCRGRHLYDGEEGLVALLDALLTGDACGHVCSLPLDADAFCWQRLAPRFDDLFEEMLGR